MVASLAVTACIGSTPLEDLGGEQSEALAVNADGVIVGRMVQGGQVVSMVFEPGTSEVAAIPGLNGTSGTAFDVNDQGQVVGSSYASTWNCTMPPPYTCPIAIHHAYLFDIGTGQLTDLTDVGVGAVPAGQRLLGSAAHAISDAGVVVGTYTAIGPPTVPGTPFTFYQKAFAYDSVGGTVTDLTTYGLTEAVDVNEAGQVLGKIGDHAAVVDLGTGHVTTIGTLGGTRSTGHAIDDAGLVVGEAQVEGNVASHAFVFDPGTGVMTDIGTLRPVTAGASSAAYGINDDGLVVGQSYTASGWRVFAYDIPSRHLLDLGTLGGAGVLVARDINDAGVAVGSSLSSPAHAWRTTVSRHY